MQGPAATVNGDGAVVGSEVEPVDAAGGERRGAGVAAAELGELAWPCRHRDASIQRDILIQGDIARSGCIVKAGGISGWGHGGHGHINHLHASAQILIDIHAARAAGDAVHERDSLTGAGDDVGGSSRDLDAPRAVLSGTSHNAEADGRAGAAIWPEGVAIAPQGSPAALGQHLKGAADGAGGNEGAVANGHPPHGDGDFPCSGGERHATAAVGVVAAGDLKGLGAVGVAVVLEARVARFPLRGGGRLGDAHQLITPLAVDALHGLEIATGWEWAPKLRQIGGAVGAHHRFIGGTLDAAAAPAVQHTGTHQQATIAFAVELSHDAHGAQLCSFACLTALGLPGGAQIAEAQATQYRKAGEHQPKRQQDHDHQRKACLTAALSMAGRVQVASVWKLSMGPATCEALQVVWWCATHQDTSGTWWWKDHSVGGAGNTQRRRRLRSNHGIRKAVLRFSQRNVLRALGSTGNASER